MIGRATPVPHSQQLTAMRLFYSLGLIVLLSGPASAQRSQDDGGPQTDDPELVVTGSPAITAGIYNFAPTLPPAYWPYPPYDPNIPQSTFYLAPSFFQRVETNGDTVGTGTAIVGSGVTAPGVVALDPTNTRIGGVSEGCSPERISNLGNLAGKIVLIARGTCSFYIKFQVAEAAGAVGVVVYQPVCRSASGAANAAGGTDEPELSVCSDPNSISGGMGGTPPAGEPNIGIPGVIVPAGIAQPIIDELRSGASVTLQIRDRRSVAAAEAPPATSAALAVTGANPFAASTTLRLATGRAETVRVDVLDALGRRVQTLFNGPVTGERALTLSSAGLAPGVYVVRATGETFRARQTVTVVR